MQTPSPAAPIGIVIVEDDMEFLHALRQAIEGAADMRVLSVASTRAQGLQALLGVPADVLLVDLGLPDGSGIDVIRQTHQHWPQCNIMVCTAFGDEQHVMRSLEAGAVGYLIKDSTPNAMLSEIRKLHAGGSPISPLIARQILMRLLPGKSATVTEPTQAAKPSVLSVREKQVLEFITKGFTADEIAQLMGISSHTVQTFVRRIYSKLEVRSKAEAIYEARSRGLLDD
jgi:DNA-binding NarL/FixJ family response regulator